MGTLGGLYGYLVYSWGDTSVDLHWKIGKWNPAPQHFHLLLHSTHRYFTRANPPRFSPTDVPNLYHPGKFRTYFSVGFATIVTASSAQHGSMVATKTSQEDQTRWNWKLVRYAVPADLSFPKAKHIIMDCNLRIFKRTFAATQDSEKNRDKDG